MASNLLIGTLGIWERAATVTPSLTMDSSYPAANLAGGCRTDMARVATAASGNLQLTLNCSAAGTFAANFLYLANANLLKKSGVDTITLKGGSTATYASATTVTTLSSFTSATLQGQAAQDYVTTFATSGLWAYWFLNYNSPTLTTLFQHSKAFFGTVTDPGRDPSWSRTVTKTVGSHAQRRPYHTFSMTWDGIPYASAAALHTTLAATRFYRPVVLFTTSYTGVLGGFQCVLCRVTELSAPPTATGVNRVTATFEEMI